MPIVDILEKLLFPKIEHFTPDWAQNFLLGILSTHSSFYTVKKKSVNNAYSENRLLAHF